jgi:hypothetical protein
MKLRRQQICRLHQDLIDSLYQAGREGERAGTESTSV